jgi:hypothetical protein
MELPREIRGRQRDLEMRIVLCALSQALTWVNIKCGDRVLTTKCAKRHSSLPVSLLGRLRNMKACMGLRSKTPYIRIVESQAAERHVVLKQDFILHGTESGACPDVVFLCPAPPPPVASSTP